MKAIVINGSPKGLKSNTYKLTKAFLEGLNYEEVSEYHLCQMNIKPCLGCFSCWKDTPGCCILKDDMKDLLEKLIHTDLVIWSFPLYYYSVPGPLKTFIDRHLPLTLPFMDQTQEHGGHPSRYDLSKQRHILISTCGFHEAKGNYDSVLGMFSKFLPSYSTLFCGQGELFRVPELKNETNRYLEIVKTAGYEFRNGDISQETERLLNEPLFKKEVFEAMADASWGLDNNESLTFTKQMAALYNNASYKGKDYILEMHYTDLNQSYQIILGKDKSTVITENFKPYTTRIHTPYQLWLDIASDNIRGDEALMKGMYQVEGDLDILMSWDNYFGFGPKETGPSASFINLLLPWILLWIFHSINIWGVVAGCILLFDFNKKYRITIYDILSKYLVLGLSILSTFNFNILPLSYICFGSMWILSCLKTPLTSYYSMKDYGGDHMLENPIFLKTNQILTLLWGIYYLVISPFIQIPSIQIISQFMPILLGVFTAWFSKWYPEHIMKKPSR